MRKFLTHEFAHRPDMWGAAYVVLLVACYVLGVLYGGWESWGPM